MVPPVRAAAAAAVGLVVALGLVRPAGGQPAPVASTAPSPVPVETPARVETPAPVRPGIPAPARGGDVFQFRPYSFMVGAIDTSVLLWADALCPPSSTAICPFGNGGGIFIAYGRRYEHGRELLGAYDVSVRNARNLFSSATLQQFRVEHRWVTVSARTNFEAFLGVAGGLAVYGERFGVTTVGPVIGGSAGANYYLSPFVSIGLVLRLDALRFLIPFDTGDGVLRGDGGVATLLAAGFLAVTFLGN